MTLEELQAQVAKLTEQIEALKSEAAAHRKGKAEEKAAREAAEAKLADIEAAKKKAEDDALRAKGNVDEILARKDAEHKAALEKANANAATWQKRFESKAIDEALVSAASKGNAHDPAEIAALLRANVALDEKGDVFIKSGEGVATDEKGARVSVGDYVAKFLSDKPHHVKASGSGTGSEGSGSKTGGATMKRSDFDAKPATEQASFLQGGGKLVD